MVFTALVLLAIAAAVVVPPLLREDSGGMSLLSPGRLAKAHSDYEGEEGCVKCHVPSGGLSEALCLDCHEPLATRLDEKIGYHAKVEGKCDDCHSDHLGLDYEMIRWPPAEALFVPTQAGKATEKDFDHEPATGLPLTGAHEVACDACHKLSLIVDAELMSFKKEEATYLGLGTDCSACHLNPHVPTQGNDCGECHADDKWAPAPNFEHKDTRYPLEGKHEELECKECHLTETLSELPKAPKPLLPTYEPIAPKDQPIVYRGEGFGKAPATPVTGEVLPKCFNCHENPHREGTQSFAKCADCHTAHAWTQADSASFDHGATSFPLTGGHAKPAVSCADCHGKVLNDPARTTCVACHEKDDTHKGGFDREMTIARESCGLCHTDEDWKTSTYAIKSHPLALIESHGVSCEKCHGTDARYPRLPARAPAKVGPLEEACASCHEDVHQNKLGQDCASCHGYKDWQDQADLDAAGHAKIGFPLVDAHLTEADCKGCHGGRTAEGSLRRLALADVRVNGCVVCHEDAHAGQLSTQCGECHNEKVFTPSLYSERQHKKARMPLDGAHRAVPCEICHVRDLPNDVQRFRWSRKRSRCNDCHKADDPHKGQFAKDCGACHTDNRWIPSTFGVAAHAKVGFPLEGQHDVACASCHVTGFRHGKAVSYAGTPAHCAGCHEDIHGGQFANRPGGCAGCHGLDAWTPTTFDHAQCRFPLVGKHRQAACSTCHLSSKRTTGTTSRDVVHYFPIEARECDDCHVNPHSVGEEGK